MEVSFDLKTLDELIRSGHAAKVRSSLSKIKKGDVAREQLVAFADLARRVQMPELVVRWLRPVVRPEVPVFPEATTLEKATYALGLSRLGVFREATLILKSLPNKEAPQVLYYLGLLYIEQWDYSSAEAYLQKYISSPLISDYQKCVGRLNLAACFVTERNWRQADIVLNELLQETSIEERRLLRANTYELSAQSKIFRGRTAEALKDLARANEILSPGDSQYSLFIRKWEVIAGFIEAPEKNLAQLSALREEALTAQAWETVRECDLFRSSILQNEDSFLNVYFGSSFSAYKKRILRIYHWASPLPLKKLIPVLKCQGDGVAMKIDLTALGLTTLERKLFELLLSDQYRPFSLPQVFGLLYSDEYFNPESSVGKVERLAQRLRHALERNAVPLVLKIENGRMHLEALQPIFVEVQRKHAPMNARLQQKYSALKTALGQNAFSVKDVALALATSPRSADRFVRDALASRLIQPSMGKFKFR